MSHSSDTIICPNCGTLAADNYCPHCGQETHLHKETFWGLVMHFIGHYFHYDSKFWQTIKALWFSPGKLTVAYVNKQRMRYIPPISLYIFISAVYFLLSITFHHEKDKVKRVTTLGSSAAAVHSLRSSLDSLDKDEDMQVAVAQDSSGISRFFSSKSEKIKAEHGNINKFFREQLNHNYPKIFFFMIPVMALILKLLFVRRKTAFFVDHAIFSLHFHSFWFSSLLLTVFPVPLAVTSILQLLLFVLAAIYMTIALHKVYNIKWFRSVVYTFTIGLGYALTFLIAIIVFAVVVFAMA